jgi:predicted RNase H-like HicB family nuclease
MKSVYPIILTPTETGYFITIPDLEINTQGNTLPEAMEMARDAIGLMGIDLEDDGKYLPVPYSVRIEAEDNDIVTLVDVDFGEYRRKVDNRAVKKNCTIPYWMSVEADKAGVNYSRVLQDAITVLLGLQRTY